MFGHRTVALLVLNGVCLFAGDALAAEPSGVQAAAPASDDAAAVSGEALSGRDRAKGLYEEGLAAYRAGRYSDAVDKLLEADRVMPNAAFSYNIGLVYEAMGDERSALRWLRNYMRQSPPNSADAATLAKVRKFESHLQAKGMQQVSILTKPPGATVKIDGIALVGITPFTAELAPGSHVATLTLDGYQLAQRPFELRPDRSMDVEVPLVAAKPESPVATPPAKSAAAAPAKPSASPLVAGPVLTAPPAPDRASAKIKPWTWATIGVGTALLGGAIAFEAKRRSDESDAKSASQATYLEQYDRMQSAQRTARIFAIAGSGVLAAGLGLLTFDLTRSGTTKTATIGSCSPFGLCAALQGQF